MRGQGTIAPADQTAGCLQLAYVQLRHCWREGTLCAPETQTVRRPRIVLFSVEIGLADANEAVDAIILADVKEAVDAELTHLLKLSFVLPHCLRQCSTSAGPENRPMHLRKRGMTERKIAFVTGCKFRKIMQHRTVQQLIEFRVGSHSTTVWQTGKQCRQGSRATPLRSNEVAQSRQRYSESTLERFARHIVSTLGLGGKGKGQHLEIGNWHAYQLTCAPFGTA